METIVSLDQCLSVVESMASKKKPSLRRSIRLNPQKHDVARTVHGELLTVIGVAYSALSVWVYYCINDMPQSVYHVTMDEWQGMLQSEHKDTHERRITTMEETQAKIAGVLHFLVQHTDLRDIPDHSVKD